MFTGLIREIATITKNNGTLLEIRSSHTPSIGDSIAVNGACLTVVKTNSSVFSVELSDESQNILALENYNGSVHIEPAMRLSDRVEGHIVQGHVDTIGTITSITTEKNGTDFVISVDPEFIPLIVPKGSIAIDGVSLTVNEVFENSFRLTIIPHTLTSSLIGQYKVGRRVNIETDMFVRSIKHLMSFSAPKKLDWETAHHFCALY
jgi:riboflavin synthase